MSTTASGVHLEAGNRYFKRQQWREAAEAYELASRAPDQGWGQNAMIGRACALRFADVPANEALAAFAAARPSGLEDPQFWLVCIRYYLHSFCKRDDEMTSGWRGDRFSQSLYLDAMSDLDFGIERFKALAAEENRLSYPWALALMKLADWMDGYIHPRRHEAGTVTHPYRPIALTLYELMLDVDISTIFASDATGIGDEIEREIISRAQSQLNLRMQPEEDDAS